MSCDPISPFLQGPLLGLLYVSIFTSTITLVSSKLLIKIQTFDKRSTNSDLYDGISKHTPIRVDGRKDFVYVTIITLIYYDNIFSYLIQDTLVVFCTYKYTVGIFFRFSTKFFSLFHSKVRGSKMKIRIEEVREFQRS